MLDYYIYPGGNNTSNFDIRANTHYRLDIMIRGDAEVDTRIRAYTVEVLCTPEAALSNGFLLERQPMRLTLRLGGAYLRGAEDRRCAVFRVRGPMGRRCKDDGDPGPGERLRYPLLAAVLHARGVPLYVPGSYPRPLRGGRLVRFSVLLRPPDEGCTLVAEPDAGRLFEGWCRNADHTGVLSYEEQYRFSPDDDPAVIYAYFR